MNSPKKDSKWVCCETSSEGSFHLPPAICKKELVITYIESPCMFWASLVNQMAKQSDIENRLAGICDGLPRLKGPPCAGKIYGCVYSVDNNWYRCKISQVINKAQSEVLYVDYGNREVVENACLVELPADLADQHILAYPYWLLKLKNVKSEAQIEKGIEFLEELKSANPLKATMYSKTKDSVIPITVVLDSGDDLAELLVKKNFCLYMTNDEMRLKFGVPEFFTKSPSISVPNDVAQDYASRVSHSFCKDKVIDNSRNGYSINITSTATSAAAAVTTKPTHTHNAYSSPVIDGGPVRLVKLKSSGGVRDDQVTEYEPSTISKVPHGDYAPSVPKNVQSKQQQQQLQMQQQQLKQQLQQHMQQQMMEKKNIEFGVIESSLNFKKGEKELESMLESRSHLVSNRLKSLVIEAKNLIKMKVKQSKQNELKFELDKASDILISFQPTNPMLRKIASVQAVFDNLQSKIKAKNVIDDELLKLISARDSARKLLYSDLEELSLRTSQLPIEDIYEKVKFILKRLVKPEHLTELEKLDPMKQSDDSSSSFTDLPEDKFQNAILTYRSWRMNNAKDNRFVEIKVEERKKQIIQVMNYVVLVLTEEEVFDNREEVIFNNLDECIKEYEVSAREERQHLMRKLGYQEDQFFGQHQPVSHCVSNTTVYTSSNYSKDLNASAVSAAAAA
ncbi:hypothetical protein HELRODRAFT_193703, partial [Helobdella robusta]|uniref:Tudor domain-containing protein n=1 Tax=Helobdella robusta TaxID=6412 RepID=T1FVA1_HELRO